MRLLFHAQRASVFAVLTWVHKSNGRRIWAQHEAGEMPRADGLCALGEADPPGAALQGQSEALTLPGTGAGWLLTDIA